MTEDERVGQHHRLNGHEFEQALGDGEGQGGLVCCSPWGCKEFDMTEQISCLINNFGIVSSVQFSSVQPFSHIPLFANPWTTAGLASLFITSSWSWLKLMSIESVMLSNHLILCRPLFLLPSIFPGIRVFSNESVLHNQGAKVLEFQLQHQSFQ